jgi:hypothetical protein
LTVDEEPTTEELLLRFQAMVEEIEGLLGGLEPSRSWELDLPLQVAGIALSAVIGIVIGHL